MEVLLSKKRAKITFHRKQICWWISKACDRKDSIFRNINLHSRVRKQPSNNMTTLNVGGEKYDANLGVE